MQVSQLDAEGELASFRRFKDQPAQPGRDLHAQLRRFLVTRAGRKVRYGALLVDALALDRVPQLLDRALADVQDGLFVIFDGPAQSVRDRKQRSNRGLRAPVPIRATPAQRKSDQRRA